ncbi:MAG: hypothetical protein R3320_13020, partial [Nitriliruptorales bacterium]|nr:hypothetical protein [Nitriliruptorales bacterium]
MVQEQARATEEQTAAPTPQDQAAEVLIPLAAGYVGHRTVTLGMRQGLVEELAGAPDAMTPDQLADSLGFDPFYVGVWCRAALAAGVLERDGDRYRLAPHMADLLLNEEFPGLIGPTLELLEHPEMFDLFEERLDTQERTWWDE